MAANSDFCRRCEESYTPREGDIYGVCPTCEIRIEAIAEQLKEKEDLQDDLDADDTPPEDKGWVGTRCRQEPPPPELWD